MSSKIVVRWLFVALGLLALIMTGWLALHQKPARDIQSIITEEIQTQPPLAIDSLSKLACRLLLGGEAEKSIPIFLDLSFSENDFKEAAAFYLALAYLANGEVEPGKGLLTHIAQNREHTFSANASALLEKLQEVEF